MIKSYKIRLYPTEEQEQLMWKHIWCSRFIYNYMLEKQIHSHEEGKKYLSHFDMCMLITPLKNDGEHEWLREVSTNTLQGVCGDLNEAFQRFFSKKGGFPKFKSKKRGKNSFPVRCDRLWFDKDGFVHISKLNKVKYKTDFDLGIGRDNKYTNPRISNINGKWILSFGMECEDQAHILNDFNIGIDLGVKDSAIVVYNDKKIVFSNINKGKKIKFLTNKKRRLQRSISRKYEANKQGNKFIKTNNIKKEEQKLKILYARISNIRMNFIHQSTHLIVSLLPKRVIMEDLNVIGMMKNRHLSKAI